MIALPVTGSRVMTDTGRPVPVNVLANRWYSAPSGLAELDPLVMDLLDLRPLHHQPQLAQIAARERLARPVAAIGQHAHERHARLGEAARQAHAPALARAGVLVGPTRRHVDQRQRQQQRDGGERSARHGRSPPVSMTL